jgi:hypothetical protein
MSLGRSKNNDEDFKGLPKLPPNYFYSKKAPDQKVVLTQEQKDHVATAFFKQMETQMGPQIPEEQKKDMKLLGEKLYQSYDVSIPQDSTASSDITGGTGDTGDTGDTGKTTGKTTDIFLEESLAYVSENVKAGLHPRYLNAEDVDLLVAGYGNEWYKDFGYEKDDIPEEYLKVQICE